MFCTSIPRQLNDLESALARPFQTFAGEELYTTIFEKAPAVGQSIIINHPFIDGNKRTGYILMEAFLRNEGLFICATHDELYNFVIKVSTGSMPFEQAVEWLRIHTETSF